jgi:hypothetical protein
MFPDPLKSPKFRWGDRAMLDADPDFACAQSGLQATQKRGNVAIDGPISVAPTNFIFFRDAKVEFYK